MSVTFDTLTYSKRLREAGVPQEQADAHADAALYLFRAVSPTANTLIMPEARPEAPAGQVDLTGAVERMTQQVTIYVGGMIVAAFAVCALLLFASLTRLAPPI